MFKRHIGHGDSIKENRQRPMAFHDIDYFSAPGNSLCISVQKDWRRELLHAFMNGLLMIQAISLSNTSPIYRFRRSLMTTVFVLLAVWGVIGSPFGQPVMGKGKEIKCKGILGEMSVHHLRVPRGATCFLKGTQVMGRIIIEPKATLRTQKAYVQGNIKAYPGYSLKLDAQTIVKGQLQRLWPKGRSR